MHAHGQVEADPHAIAVEPLPQPVQLLPEQRLGRQVEARFVGLDVLVTGRTGRAAAGQSRQLRPSLACAPRNRA